MLRVIYSVIAGVAALTIIFSPSLLKASTAIVKKVGLSKDHACALVQYSSNPIDSALYCWGSNQVNQIGPFYDHLSSYKKISIDHGNFKTETIAANKFVNFETDDQAVHIKDFATANQSTCALLSDNSILCRGRVTRSENLSIYEPHGVGRMKRFFLEGDTPIELFASVYLNSYCARTNSDKVHCWTAHDNFEPQIIFLGGRVKAISMESFRLEGHVSEIYFLLENGSVKWLSGERPIWGNHDKSRVKEMFDKKLSGFRTGKENSYDLSSRDFEIKFSEEAVSLSNNDGRGFCVVLKSGKAACFYRQDYPSLHPASSAPNGVALNDWHFTTSVDFPPIKTYRQYTIESKTRKIQQLVSGRDAGMCVQFSPSSDPNNLKCYHRKDSVFEPEAIPKFETTDISEGKLKAAGDFWIDELPWMPMKLPLQNFLSNGKSHCGLFINNYFGCWGDNRFGLVTPLETTSPFIGLESSPTNFFEFE